MEIVRHPDLAKDLSLPINKYLAWEGEFEVKYLFYNKRYAWIRQPHLPHSSMR